MDLYAPILLRTNTMHKSAIRGKDGKCHIFLLIYFPVLISTLLISALKASYIIVYFRVFSVSYVLNRFYSTSEFSIFFNQVSGIREGISFK